MTDRLEKAIRELSPAEIEQLTRVAESLAEGTRPTDAKPGQPPKLDWVGGMKDGAWRSGLEAQEAARHYRVFLLERSMSR